MTPTESDLRTERFAVDPEAERVLGEQGVLRELDRGGNPHFLVKVPDLAKALQADVGVEIRREEDSCVVMSLLVYDIPSEPVSYDLRFYPDEPEDLRFLQRFLDSPKVRLHPCQHQGAEWTVGSLQVFRVPANVLLRLKHYSLEWPRLPETPRDPADEGVIEQDPVQVRSESEDAVPTAKGPDPRDTVIRKLKEQVQTLRAQLQERDKRVIELEDELNEIRSRGRTYRLSGEKKPWWKPF